MNTKYILIVIILAVIVGGGLLAYLRTAEIIEEPPAEEPIAEEVTVVVNKTEYKQGETVKITISNNTTEEIAICYPSYSIERFIEGNWDTVLTDSCGCPGVYCDIAPCFCPGGASGEIAICPGSGLEPGKTYEGEWHQKEVICDNGFQSVQVSSGSYRVVYYKPVYMEKDKKVYYSNEFKILSTFRFLE